MTLNTNATTSWRKKWMPNLLQEVLHNALVAAKICQLDTSDIKYIENPYGSVAAVTQQAITGTYSVATYVSTDDTLTVTEEFVWAEQIYDFEQVAQIADIKGSRMKEAMAQMKTAIDKYVINYVLDVGTGAYTTPAGGFITAANVTKILSDLSTRFAGYETNFDNPYLVVDSNDIAGLTLAMSTNGFNMADTALTNGFLTHYMGFDIYVVRAGTFVTATLGTGVFTNANHRVAGVKNIATFAMPGSKMQWMEKEVSGKTGVECAMVAYCGVKAWFQKLALTVDITLA